eukprot:COSAG06_NODE_1905_length_8095_cov_10.218984_5_plen_58_part_00
MDLLMSGLRPIRGGQIQILSARHVREAGAQDRAADPNAAAAAAVCAATPFGEPDLTA